MRAIWYLLIRWFGRAFWLAGRSREYEEDAERSGRETYFRGRRRRRR